MSTTYNYPAEVERDEDGRYVVTFPDFGWGATDGATLEEALAEARDLLRELIAATMRDDEDLPEPSRSTRRRPLVIPPVPIALKAALYDVFRKAGISQRRFARDLDIAESEVRRMLNPEHATKAATIDRALYRLGKCVSVTKPGEPSPNRRETLILGPVEVDVARAGSAHQVPGHQNQTDPGDSAGY